MTAIEYINDKQPMFIYNKHTTYENTVLQEHSAMVSGLKDKSSLDALIESQGRLFIGACMKEKATDYIKDHYQTYIDAELLIIPTTADDSEKASLATNNAWTRMINEAFDYFLTKYKVDGSKAKMAILDDILPDGRVLMDIEDVPECVKKFFDNMPQGVRDYLDKTPEGVKEFYRTLQLKRVCDYTPKVTDTVDDVPDVEFTDDDNAGA